MSPAGRQFVVRKLSSVVHDALRRLSGDNRGSWRPTGPARRRPVDWQTTNRPGESREPPFAPYTLPVSQRWAALLHNPWMSMTVREAAPSDAEAVRLVAVGCMA